MILLVKDRALLQKPKTSASAEPRFFLRIVFENEEKKNIGYAQAEITRFESLIISVEQ